jgi:hypothetical protein
LRTSSGQFAGIALESIPNPSSLRGEMGVRATRNPSRGGRAFFPFFHATQAFLERGNQVNDVAFRGLGRRSLDLLAFCVGLDQLLDLFGVSVPVFSRLEFSQSFLRSTKVARGYLALRDLFRRGKREFFDRSNLGERTAGR